MKQTKAKVSIKVKVLMASLIPLVLVSTVISVYALHTMKTQMQNETMDGLRKLTCSVQAAYDELDSGDYAMNGDHLMKGQYDITANDDLIDSFTADSEADITFFYGDTRRATSLKDATTGERIIGTQASDAVVETTLNGGEEYTSTNIVINNRNYYAIYRPVKQDNGEIVGMIFAGEPSESVDEEINSHIRSSAIIAIIFLVAGALVVSFVVNRICTVINRATNLVTEMSKGDLTMTIDDKVLKRKDELGIMAHSMQNLVTELRTILGDIQKLAGVLSESSADLHEFANNTNNATDEISRAVDDMSKGSVSQAEDVENATLQVGEMGDAIRQIVGKIEALASNSEKMEKSKNDAENIVAELASSSDHTFNAVQRIEKQVKLTDDSVTQIQQAVALITAIAEETNLLSLNASIEAARAGEAGKGFAVVASEIQKLAEESNSSATSIADVIENLSHESKNTVDAMNNMHDIIINQQQKLSETESKFGEVSAGIQSSLEQISEIRNGSEICDDARIKVTDIIQNLSAISEENAAATEETTASMQELNSTMSVLTEKSEQLGTLATQMDDDLGFFKM